MCGSKRSPEYEQLRRVARPTREEVVRQSKRQRDGAIKLVETVAIPERLQDFGDPYRKALEYWLQVVDQQERLQTNTQQTKSADTIIRALASILRALERGFEPTTPPKTWYPGLISHGHFCERCNRNPLCPHRHAEPDGSYYNLSDLAFDLKDTFPGKRAPVEDEHFSAVLVYQGFIAPTATPRIQEAVEIFGFHDIRVYSPFRRDFTRTHLQVHVEPLPRPSRDPIVIARAAYMEKACYFEIARWDLRS